MLKCSRIYWYVMIQVVFATWWQAIGLSIVMYDPAHTQSHLSKAVQNFLICIEMFVASLAFTNAFSHHDYVTVTKTKVMISFMASVNCCKFLWCS
jgi:hypothetical protein